MLCLNQGGSFLYIFLFDNFICFSVYFLLSLLLPPTLTDSRTGYRQFQTLDIVHVLYHIQIISVSDIRLVSFPISDIDLISFRHKALVSDFNVTYIRHKSIDTIKKERVDNFCRCMCGIKLGNRNMILIMHVGHKYFMLDISL